MTTNPRARALRITSYLAAHQGPPAPIDLNKRTIQVSRFYLSQLVKGQKAHEESDWLVVEILLNGWELSEKVRLL